MRDLNATKEAILQAAESLFAERGFEGTSMQDIATAAGVSRGMPGYAFGSKRQLYEAVLERAFAGPRALVNDLATAMEDGDAEAALRRAVGGYIDFLAHHPAYVRLLERAALDRRDDVRLSPSGAEGLDEALEVLVALLKAAGFRAVDPRQLLVSAMALCFFPLAHNDTLLRALGLDAHDPTFLAERKAHVVELLLNGLRSTGDVRPAPPPTRRRAGGGTGKSSVGGGAAVEGV